jgi:hypothetical protein
MRAGLVALRAEQVGGGAVNVFLGSPDGPAVLYNAGTIRADTHSTGRFRVYSDGDTDAEQRTVNFVHSDATVRSQVGNVASDVLNLRNLIHGGNVSITAEDIGGVERSILVGDPDALTTLGAATNLELQVANGETALLAFANGETQLFFNDVKVFAVLGAGVAGIIGDLNSDVDNRYLAFFQPGGLQRGRLGHFTGSDFHFRNEIHGGITQIGSQDTGGVDREMLQCDPDGITEIRATTDAHLVVNFTEIAVEAVANGKVGLRFNNIEYFRTQDRTIADNVSGAEVQDGNGVWQDVGFNVLGQLLSDANLTIDRTECGYDIFKQAGAAVTYTIPAAAATAQTDIPFGAVYEITNEDTEDLTIDGTETGITLRWCPTGGTGDRTLAQWGIARLKKRNDSSWFITGVGLT